jgi:tetratricopeptide (TPR) repeat protein
MKKHTLIIALLMFVASFANASNEAYEKAMQKEIQALGKAGPVAELQKSANAFARIAEMNAGEWLPDYYAALAYANMGFRTEGGLEEKDGYYAQAKKHIEKAKAVSPNNSEIVAVEGYIIMGELAADANSRGQSLSGLAMQTFGKAIELNRQNPRAIVLMAQMELGMAQFFGQGPEKACGLVNASLELFAKENAEAKEGNINPTWGKGMAEEMKERTCK